VYEYFLGKFAASEGKGGGEFYTPKSVVALLAEMLEPYRGKIFYAINRGKLEIWQRKFCNEGLKEVIVRNGIGGIIGHLDHEDGESQLMALCYVSRKE
jgi:hypothetical protein